jgi:hypothetical protein
VCRNYTKSKALLQIVEAWHLLHAHSLLSLCPRLPHPSPTIPCPLCTEPRCIGAGDHHGHRMHPRLSSLSSRHSMTPERHRRRNSTRRARPHFLDHPALSPPTFWTRHGETATTFLSITHRRCCSHIAPLVTRPHQHAPALLLSMPVSSSTLPLAGGSGPARHPVVSDLLSISFSRLLKPALSAPRDWLHSQLSPRHSPIVSNLLFRVRARRRQG